FFLNRLCRFKRSERILDDEKQIEAYLCSLDLADGQTPLCHFRFANSRSEPGIQLSDPVAGLLGKLFTYINRTSIEDIGADVSGLSARQHANLALLARLLDRSTDASPAFAQSVISDEDRHRAAFL